MARHTRSNRRNTSRRRRRSGAGHGASNIGWSFAIGICVLAFGGLFIGSQILIPKNRINEATLCHDDGPINVTAILLDLTEPLNNTQQERMKTNIKNEITSSSTDTMISLGVVSDNPGRWGSLFAKCKPATGEQANALYENPTQIRERYQREFLTPINTEVSVTLAGQVQTQSPIMEALQSLIADTPNFTTARGQRKLVIVSDMLQNSDIISFYRNENWKHFSGSDGESRLATNLHNVSVEIMRIPRSGDEVPPRELVDDFWTRYFDLQGSRPPSVISLGDL